MFKKKTISLLTVLTILNLVLFVLTIFINHTNEIYIQTIDQHLADANAEVQLLDSELTETKKQLFYSNKELEMIYMRNEGISYQEDDGK